jgi:hypothetical protein
VSTSPQDEYFDERMANRSRLLWALATRRQLERWEPLVAAHLRATIEKRKVDSADIWAAQVEHHFALIAARHLLWALEFEPASAVSIDSTLRAELKEGRDLHEHWVDNMPIFNQTPRPRPPARASGRDFAARNPDRGPYWWLSWSSDEGAKLLPNVPAPAVHELVDAVEREVLAADPEFARFVPERAPSPWLRDDKGGWWPAPASRERPSQQPLKWPAWLAGRARRDEPPTELIAPSPMLRKLRRAGVVDLSPAVDRNVVDAVDADRANMVAAVGPGFGFAEPFEDEPAPVAGALARLVLYLERWDQMRRLRLAASDMELVVSTARALIAQDWPARVHERALETALVVTYARGYLESSRGGVGPNWWPTEPADVELHDRLVYDLRHPCHAHTGQTGHRTLVDTSELLGLDDRPTYREQWSTLPAAELERIADLAERQRARLTAAADELDEQLYGPRDEPTGNGWRV